MDYTFQFGEVLRYWPLVLEGALNTLRLSLVGMSIGPTVAIAVATIVVLIPDAARSIPPTLTSRVASLPSSDTKPVRISPSTWAIFASVLASTASCYQAR